MSLNSHESINGVFIEPYSFMLFSIFMFGFTSYDNKVDINDNVYFLPVLYDVKQVKNKLSKLFFEIIFLELFKIDLNIVLLLTSIQLSKNGITESTLLISS